MNLIVSILFGDSDDDGEVTVLVATLIQRSEVGNTPHPTLIVEDTVDVDGDGCVSIINATLIHLNSFLYYCITISEKKGHNKFS